MAKLDFESDVLLAQARGNQSAIWHLAVSWARQHQGSVDGWASFVGQHFAPSWDELGEDVSAQEVARLAGLNMATTADMEPVDLSGDDTTAVLTLKGPDPEWLGNMGTTIEDLDQTNELVFSAIAERRGLRLTSERDGEVMRLTFTKLGAG
jgi:hypothetical protein